MLGGLGPNLGKHALSSQRMSGRVEEEKGIQFSQRALGRTEQMIFIAQLDAFQSTFLGPGETQNTKHQKACQLIGKRGTVFTQMLYQLVCLSSGHLDGRVGCCMSLRVSVIDILFSNLRILGVQVCRPFMCPCGGVTLQTIHSQSSNNLRITHCVYATVVIGLPSCPPYHFEWSFVFSPSQQPAIMVTFLPAILFSPG